MTAILSYRDLQIWQKAIAFTKQIYVTCATLPKEEIYGLASQMKRSSVSIAANIAEGHARASTKDYLRFLNIAYSSLAEVETHLILSCELQLISEDRLEEMLALSAEIGRMLNGLRRSLEAKITDPRTPNPEPLELCS